jgi:RNA polymerase sigma-70 factor (ECF subfamily)
VTGSAADADDVFQETFVRAIEDPPRDLDAPLRPWLVKVSMNLGKDSLRRRRRREYRGAWLPSPVSFDDDGNGFLSDAADAGTSSTTERRYDLLESVSMAFLAALEVLTPQQRAVLLLRDVLDYDVRDTSKALGIGESNVKTTLHRARGALSSYDAGRLRASAGKSATARRAIETCLSALVSRDVAGLKAALSEDVIELSDGGGEFVAALNPIVGRDRVVRFFLGITPDDLSGYRIDLRSFNGAPAFVVRGPASARRRASRFVVLADVDDKGRIRRFFNVLASAKLDPRRLRRVIQGPCSAPGTLCSTSPPRSGGCPENPFGKRVFCAHRVCPDVLYGRSTTPTAFAALRRFSKWGIARVGLGE